MRKLNYSIILFLFIATFHTTHALDVEYGTILSVKGTSLLVQYYGVGKKQNYICVVTSRKCTPTKKVTLGITPTPKVNNTVMQELKDKKAGYITFSPVGNLLAYYRGGTDEAPTRTYTLRDLTTKIEYTIGTSSTSYWDLVEDQEKVFDFSPDATKLAYIDDKDGVMSIYSAPTAIPTSTSIVSTKLATLAYQVDDFIFSDNDTLYYVGNTKENPYLWSLYRYVLKTGVNTLIAKNVSYVDPLRKIGNTIVFNQLQAKGYGPALYNLSIKKVQQFTIPNISTKSKITNEEVIVTDTIHGVLMTPTKNDTSKTYPLVIWLHGGPYRQTSLEFHPYHSYGLYDSMLELLRKNNVIVLKLDYPGSFGYGRNYAESVKGSVGKADVDNVMTAITYAKNRYHISDTYLMGNSYGGYLSLKALVDHPDAFTGVMSINGVTDWESLLVKMKTSIFNTEFNGLPDLSNRSLYDTASIKNGIANIGSQKIAIIAGEADRTIPFWQATDLYAALKTANKDVTLVSYKGEDHVYKNKKTLSDLCKQMFTFIGKKVDKECSK